jgi:hypothetical protein
MISGSGPLVGQDADSFFQSDRDLELKAQKLEKEKKLGELGQPIKLKSKILNCCFDEPSTVYCAESGYIVERVDLAVNTF